ncbi:hypothetical protein Tco_0115497 [Tanacetum coccineum]
MQMLYFFVNNIHVDYAELLWEGLYYSLHHPTSSISYPRFTKIIISHYMTYFLDISRRARDCFVNNIHVDYAELMWEGIYYSLHHPATSIPYPRFTKIIISHYMTIFPDISRRARDAYHNLQDDDIMKNIFNSGRNKNKFPDSSQLTKSTQGTHRTPSAPRSPNPATETAESMPSAEKADEMILQDMIQVSLAEHKSREEQEARENVALYTSTLQLGDKNLNDKESPEVEIVIEGGGERKGGERGGKRGRDSKRHGGGTDKDTPMGRYGYLFAHLKKKFMPRTSSDQLADNLHDVMVETLPSLVKEKVTEQVKKEVHAQQSGWLVAECSLRSQVPQTACRSSAVRIRDQDDPYDDAHPEGKNSAKRKKTSEYEAYVSGESSSGQVNVEELDEIPTNQVTQDIREENLLTIDEAEKEILSLDPRKITPLFKAVKRSHEAPTLSLINQDLLYLKKGNSSLEKIVLSLHKFPAIIFNDDDIEE